ncbi:beta-propeller domain-containing protein [Maricaulaceae bacterium NA33B04]|nr:beta-propeller domain-containing protein [Maricaulaceae bacterium NA33B04]
MDREQPDYSASAYSGVSQTLEQFGSDAAYLTYLDQRDRRPSAWRYYRRLRQGIAWKSIQEVEDPLSDCPVYDPDNPACFDFGDEVGENMIVVTASRATSPTIQTSMTNNQVAVVDEGGVVKRIGDRVIVLRDGRLFILNVGEGENAEPVMESRVDLYDDRDEGTWFDELLVSDKRIVVIGFSYEYDASSYSVYDLSDGGEVSFVGRFLVSSEDYFDGASYAARMIGDEIVFEFPIDLFALDPEETTAPSFFKPDRDGDGEPDDVFPLVDAADVYRPVTDHEEPVVQAFVKCELEALALRGPDGACQRVAFISGDRGQFYIGPTAAYFWSNAEVNIHQRGEDCLLETFNEEGATPAHRIDLETMELSVAAGFGEVDTPYWMAEQSDALFGLVRHREPVCRDGRSRRSQTHLGLARLDMSAFGQRYVAASRDIVRPLPLIGRDRRPMPRFFEDRLIYGSMRGPIRDFEGPINASVVVIDLMQEGADQILPISHTVARIEAGDRTTPVVIGYAGDAVVEFTALDVSGEAELRATVQVEDRVIAESRTHAFNATTYNAAGRDGALMGLATGPRPTRDDDWRWWQRQGEAGVSFLQLEDDDFITLGAADPQNGEVSEAYECEVSCVDWYGVVRAFYLNNRVFALTNTELIEVDLFQGDQLEVLNRTRLDSEPLRQGD